MQPQDKIKALADDLNFYGKRKRDSKLEVAEKILTELGDKGEPADLVDWLILNKPEKAPKRTTASAKPAANTMVAGHDELPALPVIADSDLILVVGVQNNTPPNMEAWNALLIFAQSIDARIICLPIYYNKNAFSPSVEDEGERFDPAFHPYLLTEDTDLFFNGGVTLRPSAAINPTAKIPINAAASLNAGELATVVPSPKQQLRTLPRSPSMPVKEAWSTGVMTQINYTRSRAGAEAGADHTFGGILFDLVADDSIMSRNIEFLDGEIYDYAYSESSNVMVLGDLHSEMKDPDCWDLTLEMVRNSGSELIAVHDILHFSTASHHNRNDGKHLYQTRDRQVVDDLLQVIDDLNELAEFAPVYVVESNHNSALDNWLHDIGYNPKRDPRQAKIYYLLNWLVCDSIDNDPDPKNALQVAFENLDRFQDFPELSDRVVFGDMDKSFFQYGVDLSQHGHKGQNGSAGNTALFSKWRVPMVTGHTHSPAIMGKVLTVGVTASLKQGYNRGGASSWRQSHGYVFPNGAKQIAPVYPLSF